MPVLNFHNFSTFYVKLLYVVELEGFNFETTAIPTQYVELRCDRAFSESYMAVSLVNVTKLAYESLEVLRPLYVISSGVKNC